MLLCGSKLTGQTANMSFFTILSISHRPEVTFTLCEVLSKRVYKNQQRLGSLQIKAYRE